MTAQALVAQLTQRGETLACAESLTGGLLCDRIVQVPGASKVFMGGIVAYDTGRKVTLLGVDPETLRRHTAVSAETAAEMARGARRRLQTTWALSATGYAGPDGDDVGLVYIALDGPHGTVTRQCRFAGGREAIRNQAAQAALNLFNLE